MSKRKQARGSEWAAEKVHKTKVDADRKVAEITEDAQRLDERRKAQIRLQIDSINRLLNDPSAADEIVRVTENAAANRYLVDALLDRVNAYHSSAISAERFFVMIGEAIENRNRMVVGDEPEGRAEIERRWKEEGGPHPDDFGPGAPASPASEPEPWVGEPTPPVNASSAPSQHQSGLDLDLSGAEQEKLNDRGIGWGNKKNGRSKRHYYSRPGEKAPSLCRVAIAPDRIRTPDTGRRRDYGPRGDCTKCANLVGGPESRA